MKLLSLIHLLACFFLSLFSFAQSVPNSLPVELDDVYNAVHSHTSGTTFDLNSCLSNAISSYYDATYNNDTYAPANSILRFRNYGVHNALPSVSTSLITSNASGTVVCGGNVSSQGASAVTDRGVTWATAINKLGVNKTHDGTGTGSFTSTITGLTSGQVYYRAAYATNSQGTTTGIIYQFTAN